MAEEERSFFRSRRRRGEEDAARARKSKALAERNKWTVRLDPTKS